MGTARLQIFLTTLPWEKSCSSFASFIFIILLIFFPYSHNLL